MAHRVWGTGWAIGLSRVCSIACGMAGGMGRKGDRASLHERIHGAPPPLERAAPTAQRMKYAAPPSRVQGLHAGR